MLVLVLVGALYGYQRHTKDQLARSDRISCHNRKVLFRNQRLVLRYLHSHPAGFRAVDPLTGVPWRIEFAERIPSTDPPQCK